MADFYAKYPANSSVAIGTQVVEGEGAPGTPTGGVLTVQGDPAGTPLPVSGTVTASNPSVSATGAAVPASATMVGGTDGTDLRALAVSASGVLSTSAAQSGTWNIDDITGTVSLPTGAATEAKQPAFGTAGTSSADVLTVQGRAAMTPLLVDGSGSTQPISGTVTANQGGTWNIATVTAVTDITNALPAGSNIIGNVRIDQTTPGTTNGVVVNATTTTTASFQAEGSIAFGALTNNYQTVFTPAANTKILQMRNNTNAAVSVSLDAGSTLNYVLDAGDQVSLDFKSNFLVSPTAAIQAKYTVGAPTSGSFRVNGCS